MSRTRGRRPSAVLARPVTTVVVLPFDSLDMRLDSMLSGISGEAMGDAVKVLRPAWLGCLIVVAFDCIEGLRAMGSAVTFQMSGCMNGDGSSCTTRDLCLGMHSGWMWLKFSDGVCGM